MQVLMIRIEELKDKISVNFDNLSREDSTDAEKSIADSLEGAYKSAAEKIMDSELATLPGTRAATPSLRSENLRLAQAGWIDVNDSMPESSTATVLIAVWANYKIHQTSEWEQGLCLFFRSRLAWKPQGSNSECQVSHWIPLPEPPITSN